MTNEPAFDAWKQRAADADILDVAETILGVKFAGRRRREMSAPCPRCGGEDRFSVNTVKQIYNCRGAGGGRVVDMVMHARGVEYLAACEIITGEAPPARGTQLTAEAQAKADAALAASKARAAKREADENAYRAAERERTADMYNAAHPFAGSTAADYIALRGLAFPPTPEGRADRLRCIESLPYVVHRKGQEYEVLTHAPAMVAPIVDAERKFRGLHITYLDLAEPKGKLKLVDPKTGKLVDAKKSRGSKQGNRVELIGPREPRTLVLGEGSEKVIAVWRALAESGWPGLDQWAFWSACDLGNLSGPAVDKLRHPTKRSEHDRPVTVDGLVPDFNKPGIVIPNSVVDLVLLGDTTSDDFTTRLAMCRAAARYARPGLAVSVAWAPEGADFDDLWRDQVGRFDENTEVGRMLADAGRAETANLICKIVDRAGAPIAPEIAAEPARKPRPPRAPKSADTSAEAARDRASDHQARHDQTGDGAAGAPIELPSSAERSPAEPPDAPGPTYNNDSDAAGIDAALGAPPPSAAAPPEPDDEIGESSRQGRPGARSANRAKWAGPPRKYGEGRDALNIWLAFFPLTELGLVERYVQREKGRLCYCPALGWLAWSGKKWMREGADGKAVAAGHETVRALQDEAASIRGTEHDVLLGVKVVGKGENKEEVEIYLSDQLEAFGRASETKARMTLDEHAKPYLSHEVEEFDADHLSVNILNGTLVICREKWSGALPSGWTRIDDYIRLKPHDPLDLITKLAPMTYQAGATCPLYDRSMALWQPEPSYRTFLDDWDGYSLTGDAAEQKLVLNIGTGKNGKSTWTGVKRELLGDYCESVPITTLMDAGKARSAGQATPDLAMLRTIRGLLTSEPPHGWKLDEGLVKDMTGGDKFNVRELHQKYFKLDPRFKLTIAGNHKPNISAGDRNSGIWRRVILVDWKVVIPQEQRDLRILGKLLAEGSGILNRWLVGLTRWIERGLVIPDDIADATEQFREDRDLLGRFLSECSEPRDDARAGVTETYELFVAWAKANGEVGRHEWSAKGLKSALEERGYRSRKISSMHWIGFRLTKGVNDFVDHEGKPLSGAASDERRDGVEREGDQRGDPPPMDGF